MNLYGLIGYPLTSSFSKQYFTEKFEREQIRDCRFESFPLTDILFFPELINQQENLKGLAVTIPYKEKILPYLDVIDMQASAIGAVNCISIDGNVLTGYNTDALGFESSLVPLLKPHHQKALILGTGGASKAVQFVIARLGIAWTLVSRDKNLNGNLSYEEIDKQVIEEHTLVINTTPVGMSPNNLELPPIPYQFLGNQHLLYDLIYCPAETLFLKAGRERGSATKNGYEMLVLQAEENWRIWNK